ncbi:MAG: high-potential iron-sulfur protein [Thiobacillus sp.]|nr:high-potential iron-sulfur protein [Thiobacillus sp.]
MNSNTLTNRRPSLAHSTTPASLPQMEADMPSRRIVLRGALAAGCSLMLPAALLMGCDAPQEVSSVDRDNLPSDAEARSAASPSSDQPSGQMAAAPAEAVKSSQASVQYQAQPKGEQKCGNCMHFVAESNTCKRVDGTINPQGWCIIWANAA